MTNLPLESREVSSAAAAFGKEKNFSWKRFCAWAAVAAVLALFTPLAQGQANSTVNGTVTDTSGAVIPNATVTLTNDATKMARTITSNAVGAFRFPNIDIGTYTLEVTAPGFAKFTRTNIIVTVATTLEADAKLTVGSEAQTVTVAAQALQVQTQTSEVSTLISAQQVENLATNGRNIVQLAALGTGVANTLPSFGGVNALTSANGISFNGTRVTHNVYLLDGGELNDRGCGGCYMVLPAQDAIAEFRTLSSNYSPDYGIGSGGTIIMVIKSGTSRFHGELYEYNRNTAYNANDYFNKQAGRKRPEFMLNYPGGNLGGPLFIPRVYNTDKKRTFFFVNEEWRRVIQGSAPSVINTVMANNFPTAGLPLNYTLPPGAAHAPIVPNLPQNPTYTAKEIGDNLTPGQPFPTNAAGQYVIPADLIDQNAVLQVNTGYPKPNLPSGYQYISSNPQPTYVREDVLRIDHSINSKLQLMGHYVHDAVQTSFYPPLWTGSPYPTVGSSMLNPSFSVVITLTQTYSPTLLNETSIDYSGNKINLSPIAAAGYSFKIPSGWTAKSFFPLSYNAGQDMPQINLQGTPLGTTWTEAYFPWRNGYEGFEYRDDLSWTKGHHLFKFGAGILHDYKNQQLQANTQGTANFSSSAFSGDSYINFMLGLANSFTQLQTLTPKHWVNNNVFMYGNDDWHITPRLVLNLGLRYDWMPHAYERYNQFANFVPADYNFSLPYPLNADGTINPASLTTFSCNTQRCNTNGQAFYLNGIREANVNGFPKGVVANDFFTIEPRLGFNWDIFGTGKTVLRGGGGVFFERVQGNDVYNAALNPPFAYQPSANNVFFSDPHVSVTTGQTTSQTFPSTMTNIEYHYPAPGTATFSLGVQHELAPSMIMGVQYVGSVGWAQNNDRGINTLPLTDPTSPTNPYGKRQGVANGSLNANLYRQFPGFSSVAQEENTTSFNYNSLQASLRMENIHGLAMTFSYTYSHLLDYVQNDLNFLSNPFNPHYDYGSDLGYDQRHIFNATYIYTLPFFRTGTLLQRDTLGGWTISGITAAHSGTPINVTYSGVDLLGLGGQTTNRPNLVSKISYPKTQKAWFSKSSYADPTAPWSGGTNQGFGNARKDSMVGPGLINWNISLYKDIFLTGQDTGPRFQLRFESFNTFNHTDFTSVNTANHDPNFGQVTADWAPRVLELGGKFMF